MNCSFQIARFSIYEDLSEQNVWSSGLSEHYRDTYYCRSPHSSLREGTLFMLAAITNEEIHCFLPNSLG